MKRILLTGAALAGLFTAGIPAATAIAASSTKTASKKTVTKTVPLDATCKLSLTTLSPAGSTAPVAGGQQGVNVGGATCGKPVFGGIARLSYTLATDGSLSGKFQNWFKAGTIYGTYTLDPSAPSGPPTATSFAAADFTGTAKLTGATGKLAGDTGTATLSCSTTDSVHFACTEKLKLSETVTVTTTTTTKKKG